MRRWVLLAVVLAVAAAGVLVVRDVRRAEAALTEARQLVSSARTDMAEGELAAARRGLATAAEHTATARRSVDGPVWGVAAGLPAVGDGPRTLRRIVDLADVAVEVAGSALDGAAPLVSEGDGLAVSLQEGRADLGPLTNLATTLDQLPRSALAAARDHLAETGDTLVPGRLRAARADALVLADEMRDLLDVGQHLTALLPGFLGADGPREYLLALQNPAELRGTGGLIGMVAVMRFDDGAFALVPPSDLDRADERLEDNDLPAARTSTAYEQRYGHRGGASMLQNVNLDPDLPTVAPVLLELWERRIGDRLDGVIVMDPVLLADILRVTGPLELPAAFTRDERIPTRLSADDLLHTVTVDAYEVFGGDTPRRRAFLEVVASRALARLTSGEADPAALARTLARATEERHLQLHSGDPDEQAHVRALGIGGALAPAPGADLLAVTANNAGANKQDVHVGHAVTWEVTLQDLAVVDDDTVRATRRATTTVLVANPLPTSGMHTWILDAADAGEGFGDRRIHRGLNRTWFTLWLPPDGEVLAGRGPQGPLRASTDRVHGQQAVDVFLDTPSRSERSFRVQTRAPTSLRVGDGHLRWTATLWRQAKAVPDDMEVVFRPPDGWEVADATIAGGGDGDRAATSVDPRPDHPVRPELDVHPDRVRLRGQVTADVRLAVDLVPVRTR